MSYDTFTPDDWSKLDGDDWSRLLFEQPQLAEHCDWSKLDGWGWSRLLRKQPQFAEHCDWSKLDGEDWCCLLLKQPQLEKYRIKSRCGLLFVPSKLRDASMNIEEPLTVESFLHLQNNILVLKNRIDEIEKLLIEGFEKLDETYRQLTPLKDFFKTRE